MARKIYLLYSCDEWKSNAKTILATASLDSLKVGIIECIKKDDMTYTDGRENLSVDESLALFEQDWVSENERLVNDRLGYGFFETVTDGELF